MCVLLCANSTVREWLDVPQALAYRQARQLCPVSGADQSPTEESRELGQTAQRRVMKRSAWLQPYCRYHALPAIDRKQLVESSVPSASSREWYKAFEAIAQTWGRLLSLVGLR